MNKNSIVCRYAAYAAFCFCAAAYTVLDLQMLFTPCCLLFMAAAFAAKGTEKVKR